MERDFLGCGWAHPLRLEETEAQVRRLKLACGLKSIEESIRLILRTRPGERPRRPEFGCGVEDLLFSPINTGLLSQVEQRVEEALRRFEPRIEVEEVKARAREGRLEVEIFYRVRQTNSRHNLVYPFFLEEK